MRDQTPAEWVHMSNQGVHVLGTLVMLMQNRVKAFRDDVMYSEVLQYCGNAIFFQWVPHAVASPREVRAASCFGRCVSSCRQPGCICEAGECV